MVVQRVHRRYPSDLADAERGLIEPYVRAAPGPGRPREPEIRAVIGALRSITRARRQWESPPEDFPNQTGARYSSDQHTPDGARGRIDDAPRERSRQIRS